MRRRRRRLITVTAWVTAVVIAAAVGVQFGLGAGLFDRRTSTEAGEAPVDAGPAPTSPPCVPLPYQPCGQPVAPFTDGRQCISQHDDIDEMPTNGCEAAPDLVDGSRISPATPLVANLVPRTDVDHYTARVGDGFQLFCNGRVRVTLTAPADVTMRLTVDGPDGRRLGSALSGGDPADLRLADPNCLNDDATTLSLTVASVTGVTAADYRIQVTGSY